MGIIKRAADLAFTFRFLRMLVMKWESWDAYKLGIIDDSGKRVRGVSLDTDEKKSAYTPFIRLVANIKKLVGQNKFTSLASALYLMKEQHSLSDDTVEHIMKEANIDTTDLMLESSSWFVINDHQLAPGVYKVKEAKLLNTSCEDIVNPHDKIRVADDCYPTGQVAGLDIYEATHIRSNQKVFITIGELLR